MKKRETRTHRISPPKALLWLLPLLLMGNRACWDTRTGGLLCTVQNVVVQPGQCVPISNPCDTQWQAQDGFRLCNPLEGLSTRTTRSRGTVTRELCADPSTPNASNVSVGFLYSQVADFGEGTLNITVGFPLSVTATATPDAIVSGGHSQLQATTNGGAGGYTYFWSPSNTLSDYTIGDPIASPIATTTYTVTVTDANGGTAYADVTVTVTGDTGSRVSASANPTTIDPGGFSQLNAVMRNVVGVPIFSWSPAGSVSNPTIASPLASPFSTTTYTVTAMDAVGTEAASVTVEVNLQAFASANPTSITAGEQSQLSAFVAGGSPPYTFNWSPADSLDDPTVQNPFAQPLTTTNYTLTVTDANASQASGQVEVVVADSTVLTAVLTLTPISPFSVALDGSQSTGPIQVYRFWCNWTGAGPPYFEFDAASGVRGGQCVYELPGNYTTRLEVDDGQGNTDATTMPFTVQ